MINHIIANNTRYQELMSQENDLSAQIMALAPFDPTSDELASEWLLNTLPLLTDYIATLKNLLEFMGEQVYRLSDDTDTLKAGLNLLEAARDLDSVVVVADEVAQSLVKLGENYELKLKTPLFVITESQVRKLNPAEQIGRERQREKLTALIKFIIDHQARIGIDLAVSYISQVSADMTRGVYESDVISHALAAMDDYDFRDYLLQIELDKLSDLHDNLFLQTDAFKRVAELLYVGGQVTPAEIETLLDDLSHDVSNFMAEPE